MPANQFLKHYADRLESLTKGFDAAKAEEKYKADLAKYKEAAARAKEEGKPAPRPPQKPGPPAVANPAPAPAATALPTPLPAELFEGRAREAYAAAREIPDVFAGLACYCGCNKSLGHRHLLDCFTDDHGAG